MAPSLVTIDASEPLEKVFSVIDRDGGVIVSNFLSPELLKESMAAIEPHFSGHHAAARLAGHNGALSEPYDWYRGPSPSLFIGPEQPSLHSDLWMFDCWIEVHLQKWAVIPGSHLWGADRIPKLEECTYAEMEPGSALFTLGSTYHAAGENKCDRSDPDALRTLFACFAQRDYYRLDQDEVLSTPIEIARTLPDDILRLAGYYKAVSGVGYVEDHQNPVEFMQKQENGIGKFGPASDMITV
ncbi:hypothetical protein FOXB_12437 [Fusarium oxysporum f. sp. conglutinans Fo5176]|uniref:Phytanoyl-CoA dioxygenase family protein n=1 Tax=Fusarium oxysporum (strain Fo5176) TaxID=660025 RepID=F9G1A5_FUSOF|nr:hypothetical protein FOXB_12437 [Fusarium oxysporum f. sp. conglutinans Fo5176]